MAQQKVDNQQKTVSAKNSGGARGTKFTGWEKFRNIIAVPLFFFSLYLFVVFISFLLQEGADVSHLDVSIKELLTNPNIKIENAGGKWGAILANWFINKGFGLHLSLFCTSPSCHPCAWPRSEILFGKNFGYGIFYHLDFYCSGFFPLTFIKTHPYCPVAPMDFLCRST